MMFATPAACAPILKYTLGLFRGAAPAPIGELGARKALCLAGLGAEAGAAPGASCRASSCT